MIVSISYTRSEFEGFASLVELVIVASDNKFVTLAFESIKIKIIRMYSVKKKKYNVRMNYAELTLLIVLTSRFSTLAPLEFAAINLLRTKLNQKYGL
jgi:hypothetical protein